MQISVVPRRDIEHHFEAFSEVGHVGKAPPIGDFADRPMPLQRILERHTTSFEPPRSDKARNRSTPFGEQGVRITETLIPAASATLAGSSVGSLNRDSMA